MGRERSVLHGKGKIGTTWEGRDRYQLDQTLHVGRKIGTPWEALHMGESPLERYCLEICTLHVGGKDPNQLDQTLRENYRSLRQLPFTILRNHPNHKIWLPYGPSAASRQLSFRRAFSRSMVFGTPRTVRFPYGQLSFSTGGR